jgi:predicted RND superfamily exporter protein
MQNKDKGNGISFAGVLAIVFIVLKLTGYISWSWWWVLAPIWIPVAIAVATLGGLALLAIREKRSKS